MKWFSLNYLCPQIFFFFFHFIHAFEMILGKYTVFFINGGLLKGFLLQTMSVGNSVLILQHLNGHITCVTVLSVHYFWKSRWTEVLENQLYA